MILRFALKSGLPFLGILALSLAGCHTSDFPQYPSNYREYVYVTNGGSNTVTVIDVVNLRVDRELQVGQNPVAVAASPTTKEIYVVNAGQPTGSGSLSIINAANNSVIGNIPLHRQPVSIEVDAEGTRAYVANSASNSISVIDLKNRRELSQLGVGEAPAAARLTPDGKTLVVTNRQGNSVSIFDAPSLNMRAVFSGCPGAGDPVLLPDSSKAFVPCTAGHQIMAIALVRPGQLVSPGGSAQPDRLEA